MSPNRSTGRVQGASLGRGRSNANAVDGAAPLLQHVELMSQYQDFGFQPRPWLEAVAQHTDEQEADC